MTRLVDANDPSTVNDAARIIRQGGIVAFPTETVYGLGADALNPVAVARIFEAKERPSFDPLIAHVLTIEDAERLTDGFPEIARELAETFWPGPLTIVVPKSDIVPDIVTAGLPTVAIRSPSHPVAISFLEAAACPIAAPSANRFGRISPTTAAAVDDQLGDRVDLILDAGPTDIGLESTIILCTSKRPALLRLGGLLVEDIEELIGQLAEAPQVGLHGAGRSRPQAPGGLPRHYAPLIPLVLVENVDDVPLSERSQAAALLYKDRPVEGFAVAEALSSDGDLITAAANLFSALGRLDAAPLDRIYAEKVPENGLGRAIMDRLRRASARE